MSNMRVYEYAQENNLSSRDVLHYLEELNIDITNHMATIDEDVQEKLNELINPSSKKEEVIEEKEAVEEEGIKEAVKETEEASNVITYTEPITVEELAGKLKKDVPEIIKNLKIGRAHV